MTFAAIDAGSNAIRLIIADADGPDDIKWLRRERYPVRLGHNVFTGRKLDSDTIEKAVDAFKEIESLLEEFAVDQYRAVGTAAAREATNREDLIRKIKSATGIELEVIDGDEEARLVRTAVLKELGREISPRLISDLGGGSLEVSLLDKRSVEASFTLPLGTVRLMECAEIDGPISAEQRFDLESRILSILHDHLPQQVELKGRAGVACGGNAEALLRIAPTKVSGREALDLKALYKMIPSMTEMSLKARMEAYDVRKDRAEVMAIAAIVFACLGRFFSADALLTPCVGVRDGTLEDLAATYFRSAGQSRRR